MCDDGFRVDFSILTKTIFPLIVEKKSLAAVMSQLNHTHKELENLSCHIDLFVDWWGSMKHSLEHLLSAIEHLQQDGTHLLRLNPISDRWENIKEQYILCVSRVYLFATERLA